MLASAHSSLRLLSAGCTVPRRKRNPAPAQPSQIKVDVKPGGPIVLTTSSAEFQILPSGYIQASLLKGDQKLTLDAAGARWQRPSGAGRQAASVCSGPRRRPKFRTVAGKLGRGKAPGNSCALGRPGRRQHSAHRCRSKSMTTFPTCCFRARNTKTPASGDLHIDRVIEQQHKFSGSLADKNAQPYDMWSFHGSSYDWGKDDVVKLGRNFRATQPDGRGT